MTWIILSIIVIVYAFVSLYKAFDQLERLTPPDLDEEDITNDIHEG